MSTVTKNIHQVGLPHRHFALDIGGSLVKLIYERTFRYTCSIPRHLDDSSSIKNGTPPFAFYDYCERDFEGRRVCLMKFETRLIKECVQFIKTNILDGASAKDGDHSDDASEHPFTIKVTGGGAYRFRELITRELGVKLDKEDEMACLMRGCVFMLRNIPDELFYHDKLATPAHVFMTNALVDTYPFLLVNIGSGVSILKVESPTTYSRVGGSSIGGGTFWGISSALCGGKYTFDELLDLADDGDHRKVDMLVKDIYGGDYAALGLPGDVIASSFGLAARSPDQPRCLADMVKSLLITVSNNIGQLACMYAKEHNMTRILFGGFFIRGHGLTMEVITYAVNFWSSGSQRALFLRHEGYLGAIGAFIKAKHDWPNEEQSKTAWTENASGSIRSRGNSFSLSEDRQAKILANLSEVSYQAPNLTAATSAAVASTAAESPDIVNSHPTSPPLPQDYMRINFSTLPGQSAPHELELDLTEHHIRHASSLKRISMDTNYLELDRVFGYSLELFPLLASPTHYVPDTWDLTQDSEARTYWLTCLEKGVERQRIKATESQLASLPDAPERAKQYAERYISYLHELGRNPSGNGVLTVRSLLSAQQHFLREFGFGDPFCEQKKLENRSALLTLPKRLRDLASMEWEARQLTLINGILTGNVFDWGAAEMIKFFQDSPTDEFGVPTLEAILLKIPPRPWLIDDYDAWLKAIRPPRPPYRCVLFFCDNSGPDVILGVIPFALEFLNRGTKVILAANSTPAINDVTHQELEILLRLISSSNPTLAAAIAEGRLMVAENGQSSPCLDLRLTASSLVQLVQRENVDLVVIEGMGRAVHTNLYAQFRIDCLKIAVIKNAWLARRLGGQLYSVLFQFQPGVKQNYRLADGNHDNSEEDNDKEEEEEEEEETLRSLHELTPTQTRPTPKFS